MKRAIEAVKLNYGTPLLAALRCWFLLGLTVSPALGVQGVAQHLPASETYREAYDAGRADGVLAGREDRGQRRPYDVAASKAFRTAERGLDVTRHNRDVYVVAYRRGFEDGYEEGYGVAGRPKAYAEAPAARPRLVLSQNALPSDSASGNLLQIPAYTLIRVKLLDSLSTHRNRRGDTFRGELVEDVHVHEQLVIPRGTYVLGTITHLKRAGRVAGRAEIGLRWEELQFRSGGRAPIEAVVVAVEGRGTVEIESDERVIKGDRSRARDTASVVSSAGIGTLIGTVKGGGKGAGIGAAVGGVAGLAGVLSTRGRDVDIDSETEIVIRLTKQADIPVSTLKAEGQP